MIAEPRSAPIVIGARFRSEDELVAFARQLHAICVSWSLAEPVIRGSRVRGRDLESKVTRWARAFGLLAYIEWSESGLRPTWLELRTIDTSWPAPLPPSPLPTPRVLPLHYPRVVDQLFMMVGAQTVRIRWITLEAAFGACGSALIVELLAACHESNIAFKCGRDDGVVVEAGMEPDWVDMRRSTRTRK